MKTGLNFEASVIKLKLKPKTTKAWFSKAFKNMHNSTAAQHNI